MNRPGSRVFGSVFLVLSVGVLAWAQFKPAHPEPQAHPPRTASPGHSEEPPTYSVKVNLVRLLVSVRDQSGALLTDLKKDDFQVLDSGVKQNIAVFERNTSLPLSVAVLIDTSGSTYIDLHYEVESVLKFIPALLGGGNPEDRFALFSFNWRTNMEVDYSRNERKAQRALRALHGEGGTSLYDAIYLASDTLAGREGRHVMVVVTDGGDTTSYVRFESALEAAQKADVALFPIVVIPIENDAGRNIGGEHALATLAKSTGGRIFYPEGFTKLDEAFTDILHELRTQYLLGFYPQNVPEGHNLFHPLMVETRDRSLRISARTGYYGP